MKRRFFYLIALLSVVFIINSCNGNSNNNDENNDDQNKNENVVINEDINDEGDYYDESEDLDNSSVEDVYTLVNLSKDERKKLNTFFSNFSEVSMEPFDENTITDAEVIDFAVFHNHINYYKRFENAGDNRIKIKKDYIDETSEKYLGLKVSSHQSTSLVDYANGFYTIDDASGETYYFSQIEDLYLVEDNYYFAIIDVYMASSGWTGDYQADPQTWKGDDVPEYYNKMTAYITKKDNRYIINEYMNFKNYQTF